MIIFEVKNIDHILHLNEYCYNLVRLKFHLNLKYHLISESCFQYNKNLN